MFCLFTAERNVSQMTTKTGSKLRLIRRNRGLTSQQVADAAGVAKSTVSRIETGSRRGPRARKRIADALGIDLSADELIDG